jgi:hypothetical protein
MAEVIATIAGTTAAGYQLRSRPVRLAGVAAGEP